MKKRILFLIESLSGGGAEKVLSVLVKYFDYAKYEVTVCPMVDTGTYCDEVKKYVSQYSPVITYRGHALSRFWNMVKYKLVYSYLPLRWVYKWFIPQGNDVEIAFCEGYVTKLLSYANTKSRKIAWIHTDLTDNPWPIELGIFRDVEDERRAYSSLDKIVCVSQAVEKSFHERYGLDQLTCTIYNPIDIDNIKERAGQRARRINDKPQLISIGRLVPQKGYERLLKVVKRLHEEDCRFHLQILGEGLERKTLEDYIAKNSMESYVSLPGFCSNPYKELINSDLFVCSSHAEGFSLVIAEAMLIGVPVISTCCSGPNELLNGGSLGLLVENSENGIYQGLKSALQNKGRMTDFIEVARKRIIDFSPSIIIHQIETLIDD